VKDCEISPLLYPKPAYPAKQITLPLLYWFNNTYMIKIGEYNLLKVTKEKPMGVFLDDGKEGILLPKRFVPGPVMN
jgi:hypothetical protein